MKKFMFAAMAALAITSCSQNEELEAPSQSSEINFTPVVSKSTRAVITENAHFNEFTAYGYAHDEVFDGTFTTTVMDGGIFKKADNWATTGHYYWPTSGFVSFFAYAGATVNKSNYVATSVVGSRPTLTYTVLSDITKQEDLVVAQKTGQQKQNEVALTFKHALTQVYFKVKGTDSNVTYDVSLIAIKGAFKTGTFTYGTVPETSIGSWGNLAGISDTYSFDPAITGLQGEGDATILNDASTQVLMLMPQELDDKVTVEVTYTAVKEGVEIHSDSAPTVIKLTGDWNAGQKLAYTLTLSGDAINLTGTADDNSWTPVDK